MDFPSQSLFLVVSWVAPNRLLETGLYIIRFKWLGLNIMFLNNISYSPPTITWITSATLICTREIENGVYIQLLGINGKLNKTLITLFYDHHLFMLMLAWLWLETIEDCLASLYSSSLAGPDLLWHINTETNGAMH